MEKKLKIVIADEGSPLSENCAKTFKAYGMSVSLCEKDGRKVIELIKKEKPDIVLADVFMPNIDILGVLSALKDIDAKDRPMVMAMSNFDNPMLEKETLSGIEFMSIIAEK